MIHLILMIAAVVLFILAAAGVPGRIGWGWAGLACWAISTLIV